MSGLPTLPTGLPIGLRAYLESLGKQFEVTQADRGSPLMAKPTIQDLIDIGVIQANATQALKVNGKSFYLTNASDWLSPAIPDWFTSLLSPPAPGGLSVGVTRTNLVLTWQAWISTYYGQTLVYRSATNDLSTAAQIGSTTGNTYVDNLPPIGGAYYYWIRTESRSKNLSDYNAVGGTTVGNIASAPSLTSVFDSTDLVLSWPTPTSALLLKYFVIRYGSTFEGGIAVGTSNTNTLRLTVAFGGTRTFWVAAVDINDQVGVAASIAVTVVPPGAPIVTQAVVNDALALSFVAVPMSLPVASYELRYGASWAAGTGIALDPSTRFETAVNWTGSRTFWIGAYDSAGNLGTITQSIFSPTVPGAVTVQASVIDNNVLLSWSAASGTLTIASYLVDRGGVSIGTIAGRFSVVFESLAGTYTYGVTPIDSAGNTGTRSTTSATVSQPPDYQLTSNVNTDFIDNDTEITTSSITMTNVAIDAATGGLLCNVDTAETWATHFSSRSWNNIDDQITAGYSTYAVGKTTGSYLEQVDYVPGGGSVSAAKITMTPTTYSSSGSAMTITPTLSTSPNGTTWTDYTGVYSAFSTAFRYVKYLMAFSATHNGTGLAADTSALIVIMPLNYRLDIKQKTSQGMVSALAADTGGTSVDITDIFTDVGSIVCTALGTTPLYVVYDFVDAANPTSFKVLVFNSSGTRVNATVSYTIRGV